MFNMSKFGVTLTPIFHCLLLLTTHLQSHHAAQLLSTLMCHRHHCRRCRRRRCPSHLTLTLTFFQKILIIFFYISILFVVLVFIFIGNSRVYSDFLPPLFAVDVVVRSTNNG